MVTYTIEPGIARNCDRFAFRTSPPMKLDVIAYSVMKSGQTIAYSVCFRSKLDCVRLPDDLAAAATASCEPPRPLHVGVDPRSRIGMALQREDDDPDDHPDHGDRKGHGLDAEVEPGAEREDDRKQRKQDRPGGEDPPLAGEVVAVGDEPRAVQGEAGLAAKAGEPVLGQVRGRDAGVGDEPHHPVPRRQEPEVRVQRAADVDVVAARPRHRRGEVGVDTRHRQREQPGEDGRRDHARAGVERRDEQHDEGDADADVLVVRVVDEDIAGGCLASEPRRLAGEDLGGVWDFCGQGCSLLIRSRAGRI